MAIGAGQEVAMEKKKLLLVGGGDLCQQILKILVPRDSFIFYVAGRDLEKVTRSCNLLRIGCLQLGVQCTVYPVVMDLAKGHIEKNAEIIFRIRPDVIFNTASLHAWRTITQLPAVSHRELDQAQFGPWLPMQLAPAYELMRAIKQAGIKVLTVNAAFPDAVNVVLDKVGMGPTTGAGGIANMIPAVQLSIARLANHSPEQVKVKMVAQQGLCNRIALKGLPPVAHYRLNYWVNGLECSGEFDDELIFRAVSTEFRNLGGVDMNFFNAISAVRLLENLFSEHELITHAPGPSGLPGGYPVRVGMGRVLLALPYGVSRADAIAVNQHGQRQDGIAAIQADGSVTFEAEQMDVMKRLLGYSVSSMKLQDVHYWAAELGQKYKAFAESSTRSPRPPHSEASSGSLLRNGGTKCADGIQ
jgi:hypothetical protein